MVNLDNNHQKSFKENSRPKSIDKVSTESINIKEEQIKELKQILPHLFTEGKIDFDKFKEFFGDEKAKKEKYSLTWPGKQEAYKNIETTAKGTLIPNKDQSVNFDSTENIFIEGDNLEVLKLLQKSYFGKVKMIYIDPPYNTGKDFVYKDNYHNSIKTYLEQTKQHNNTNPETSGRYHSDWLTMMFPRLFMAKYLLRDDGVIFVSIDDSEVHNLRLIMNEIFGEENFIISFCHKHRASISNDKIVSPNHNHILLYARNFDAIFQERNQFGLDVDLDGFTYDDGDGRGKYKTVPVDGPGGSRKGNPYYEFLGVSNYFRFSKETMEEMYQDGLIVKRGNSLYQKYFLKDALKRRKTDNSWWDDGGLVSEATKKLNKLIGNDVFNNPKPVGLIQRMLKLSTYNKGECIILDFFAGSGTTAQSVLELNEDENFDLKFILVQFPELTLPNSVAYEKGYENIAEIGKERIRRVIHNMNESNKETLEMKNNDLGFKVFTLSKSNFKIWQDFEGEDADELIKQMKFFKNPLVENYSILNVIYECVIKEGFNLNSKINKLDIQNNNIFKVTDKASFFYICLDGKINDDTINKLELDNNSVLICLDDALDDTKKSNLSMQCHLKTL